MVKTRFLIYILAISAMSGMLLASCSRAGSDINPSPGKDAAIQQSSTPQSSGENGQTPESRQEVEGSANSDTLEAAAQSEKSSKEGSGQGSQPDSGETADSLNEKQEKIETVHITIIGPKDKGTILPDTRVAIVEGDTVIDILKRIAGQKNIQLECKGIKATSYVEGIDNIYEFDYGPKSGWVCRVNGASLVKGAGSFIVKNEDAIEWLYTIDLGKEFDTALGGT